MERFIYNKNNENFEYYVLQTKPVIIYPRCLIEEKEENCLKCNYINECESPRSFCVKAYYNHPNGCPNYNKNKGCPPDVPLLDQVYIISKPIYLIINEFDLYAHMKEMKQKHPDWNYYQLSNVRYWQGKTIRMNNLALSDFFRKYPDLVATNYIESMGVDLAKTLNQNGIELIFGKAMLSPKRISLVGEVKQEDLDTYNMSIENVKIDSVNVRKLVKH